MLNIFGVMKEEIEKASRKGITESSFGGFISVPSGFFPPQLTPKG